MMDRKKNSFSEDDSKGGEFTSPSEYDEEPEDGGIPLDIRIRSDADGGRPTVVADPDGAIAEVYRDIARRTAAKLSSQKKDYSAKFPSIVIQNS